MRGSSSCLLDKLNLLLGVVNAADGSTGEVTDVVEAIVPRAVGGTILSGAYRVMEHAVGAVMAVGGMSVGLWDEGMPMTQGMLELDAALSLRSGGWVIAVVEPLEAARKRCTAGGTGEVESVTGSGVSLTLWGGAACTLDALELLRERVRLWMRVC